MKLSSISRTIIIPALYILGAVSSIIFLILPECYNGLSLDDIIFWNDLEKVSVWEYVRNLYMTWQGRYIGFFEHGIQYRIYGLFESTIPYTLLLYVGEIVMLYSSFRMFTKWSVFQTLSVSILTWGLFVMCLPDLSSYYWMCTKAYPLIISMTVWLLAKVYSYSTNKWYNWVGIVICACFVGCSTEVFAPMILVLLGVRILKMWKQYAYNALQLLQQEKVLCAIFIIATINFFVMVFSPGTFVRMEVHSDAASLTMMEFLTEICTSSIQVIKMIFFKSHYYVIFFVLMLLLMTSPTEQKNFTIRDVVIRTLSNVGITIGLFLLSMILCQWACGQAFITRAFAQLPAAIYLLLFLLARDLCRTQFPKTIISSKCLICFAMFALLFVVANNIYAICRAYPELEAYKASENARMQMIHELQAQGNQEVVFLEPLDGAEYHSLMDDMWRYIMPSYSRIGLLKSNEVANDVNHCYNVAFREYHKLNFDVISDLVYEGV